MEVYRAEITTVVIFTAPSIQEARVNASGYLREEIHNCGIPDVWKVTKVSECYPWNDDVLIYGTKGDVTLKEALESEVE